MVHDRVQLEDGYYGRRAVLKAGWSDDLFQQLIRAGVVELELNQAKGWTGSDLSFLSQLSGLNAFEIFDFNIGNIEPIHALHGLRRLGVTTYCSTGIDFSAFPRLESCGLEWRPNSTSLFGCSTLKTLFVNRYRGRDVVPFATLSNLESLSILNAPVENLRGLGGLRKLRSLRLANLRRLSSLAGVEELADLEELDVNTCRKITSIQEVAHLPRLKRLLLNNLGDIDSLTPLQSLDELESICLYESTNVVDGNLSPLLRQSKLTRVAFKNRRHYSHRREDFGSAFSG